MILQATSLCLFWLALLLPGYALLHRFDRASLVEMGPLSAIARSYLASFALLTPVSTLGYALKLPLATLSGAVIVYAVIGLGSLLYKASWPPRISRPSVAGAIGTLLLLTDMVMGARAGSYIHGDVGYHIGRVRMLLDHGFNSWDPVISGHRFDAIYHSNLYHALLAASAQVAHVRPGVAWFLVWPWTKLVCAAATGHLATTVFRERWLGWAAAIGSMMFLAPSSVLPFPNTLAAYWLLSMGIAFTVDALAGDQGYRPAIWLAVTSAVTAQVHGLDAVFLLLAAAACLSGRWVWLSFRRRPARRQTLAALLALGLCLPWLAVPALPRIRTALFPRTPSAAVPSNAPSARTPATALNPDPHFIQLAGGSLAADPMVLWGLQNRYAHTFALLALGLFSARRKRLRALASIAFVTCAALFVPALCTLILHVAGATWMLWRMTLIFVVIGFAITPMLLFWLVQPRLTRLHPAVVQVVGCVAAIAYAFWQGVDSGQFLREKYLEHAMNGSVLRLIQHENETSAFFDRNIQPSAKIAAPLAMDYEIAMHCNCYVIAPTRGRGSRGVPDMNERRNDMDRLFLPTTEPEERLAILRHYDTRYVYLRGSARYRSFKQGLQRNIKRVGRLRGIYILRMNLKR